MRLLSLAAARRRARSWWGYSPLGVLENLGIKRNVDVLLSSDITVPATGGFFKPFILLPPDGVHWSKERLDMVFGHELAHVKRKDWLWLQLSNLACALYPFNPLVWFAAYRLRLESEQASDDLVLALGHRPTAYASELLDIARLASLRVPGALSMARNGKVEGRLRSIMDGRRNRKALAGRALVCGLGVGLACVGIVAAFSPIMAAPKKSAHMQQQLPEIPFVQADDLGGGLFLAQHGIGCLPNGIRVRLVGLSPEKTNDDIWGPNGVLLPDKAKWDQGGVYWQGPPFHRFNLIGPSLFEREFYWEIESESDADVSTFGFMADPATLNEADKLNPVYAGQDVHIKDTMLGARQPAFGIIHTSITRKQDQGTYRFGVAAGPWTTIADVANELMNTPGGLIPKERSCSISLDGRPAICCTDSTEQIHSQYLFGDRSRSLDPGMRRVLLYDANGQEIDAGEASANGAPRYDVQGYASYSLRPEAFRTVARVVLQERPYQWLEFRDIALRPNFEFELRATLQSPIRGIAAGIAPGFSKTLGNGAVVSVESVCRARAYEGDWRFLGQPNWRADGQLLARPPAVPTTGMSVDSWGRTPLVRIAVNVGGNSKDANVAFKTPDLPVSGLFDEINEVPVGIVGPFPLIRPIPDDRTTLDVSVGVANGSWKTVASRAINIPELPAIKRQERQVPGQDSGIEVELGRKDGRTESATLTSHGAAGVEQEETLAPDLHGEADRCVAVLKNGQRVVIRQITSGEYNLGGYYVPARHGEWSDNNPFLASDIASIEIQARPYEWTEFDGVVLNAKK